MGRKKYDPLWEVVAEKVPLQGVEPDIDTRGPHCLVTVHVGTEAEPGAHYECGLCGGLSQLSVEDGCLVLVPVKEEEAAR
ncbi:MAG: hypothetical protein H5T84_03960 [Thermoleophilia bacterium]|nr:hypothetical protein [Thermoleophilia bacterium]